MLYADQPGAIHSDAVQLAQTLAGHVAFSLGRKQAEEKHRATEIRLKRILSSVPVVLYDAEVPHPAAATWISENVEGITGYSGEELVTIPDLWDQRLHPEDQAHF